jgi:3-dehydroquinate dehydratase type I
MPHNKICACLANTDFNACKEAAKKYRYVELRLDLLHLSQQEIIALLNEQSSAIATFRAEKHNDDHRLAQLIFAIEHGADYADIEIESTPQYRTALTDCARRSKCGIIISYHNFAATPSANELRNIIRQAADMNADIVKIAATAHTMRDAAIVASLYENCSIPLIAFAMGSMGTITRIAAPLLGAPFTYAALNDNSLAAPNQLSIQNMEQIYAILKA